MKVLTLAASLVMGTVRGDPQRLPRLPVTTGAHDWKSSILKEDILGQTFLIHFCMLGAYFGVLYMSLESRQFKFDELLNLIKSTLGWGGGGGKYQGGKPRAWRMISCFSHTHACRMQSIR